MALVVVRGPVWDAGGGDDRADSSGLFCPGEVDQGDLQVSRKVVRKVLRSEATEFHYAREQQPMPRLGAWREELDRRLAANAAKPVRERLTLVRIYEQLHGLGYAGGYDAVRRYARTWRRGQVSSSASAYVPLSFAPGEAYQFDWSHEVVLIGGRR